MRAMGFALLVLFAAGAGAREARLPVPPIPPARTPSVDAPVPDPNAFSPDTDVGPSRVTLDTDINHRPAPDPGFGYGPGAHYQIDRDRRLLVLPGVRFRLIFP